MGLIAKNINDWRCRVRERDNDTCQRCGVYKERVIAHHKVGVRDNPDLQYDVDNGQCLCRACHIASHNEQRLNVCCYPRIYNLVKGRLTWIPVLPN